MLEEQIRQAESKYAQLERQLQYTTERCQVNVLQGQALESHQRQTEKRLAIAMRENEHLETRLVEARFHALQQRIVTDPLQAILSDVLV